MIVARRVQKDRTLEVEEIALGPPGGRMRSTQFDDDSPFEKEPEHCTRRKSNTLCEMLQRLGYARNSRVKLYGEVFDLLSDPVRVSDDLVFVEAIARDSGLVRRVRIPPNVVQMAKIGYRAA